MICKVYILPNFYINILLYKTMNTKCFRFMISVVALSVALHTFAQSATDSVTEDLCAHITDGGRVVLSMPVELRKRMCMEKTDTHAEVADIQQTKVQTTGRMGGYRIQVFSDNSSRTAKGEARTRARNISSQFPDYQTYVVYNSPYWRLRVGNFKTNEEAQTAAEELRMAFPSYAREIRVVRDRIVVDAE